jgi:hypothetical protein
MAMIVGLVVAGILSQEVKTYRDPASGLAFGYPTSWEFKRSKHSADFTFPMTDGSTATLQIFNIQFRQDKGLWQQLQRDVADQMRRRVNQQWEEQILGVPLLLTRVDFNDGEKEMSTLVGLLYTATKEKMNFRVTSTAGTAQASEDAWRQTLMSLRTLDGELPVPEDPTKPLPNPDKTASGQSITRLTPEGANGDPARTKNVHRLSSLGLQLNVFLPEGWSLESADDTIAVQNEKLLGTARLSLSAGSRSQVQGVLNDANNSSFDRFKLVTLRDDPRPAVKKSGSFVASTLRVGPGMAAATAVAWHIVGTHGSVVWRIDYFTDSEESLKADRKLIEKLIEFAAVEIAP